MLAAGISTNVTANEIDCSALDEWQSDGTYVKPNKVKYKGYGYEAKWWTQANPADNSKQWDVWKLLGQCTGNVENKAPQVSVTNPINGFFVQKNDSVVISVGATDEDGDVVSVELYINDEKVFSAQEEPYEFNWLASDIGQYRISAIAKDDDDASTTSEAVTITVEEELNENQAPVVVLSAALPNEVFIGDTVALTITSTDEDGEVRHLSLKENGTEIFSEEAAEANYLWSSNATGVYQLQVTAKDDDEAEGVSNLLEILVKSKDTPNDGRNKCQPTGLYQTPDVNTPYCTVYDEQGREIMGADHTRRIIGYFTSWRNGANGQPTYLVNDIPWEKITHINYAFAHVNGQNQISIGDASNANNPATSMEWPGVAGAEMDAAYSYKGHFNLLNKYKKQYSHVKTLISVGGWAETGGYFSEEGRVNSGGFYTMTTNADGSVNHAGINAFSSSVVDFLRKYSFDGVDIDYEYPSSMNDSGHPDDFDFSNPRRAALNASYQVLMKKLRQDLDNAGEIDGKHYMLTIASPSSGYLLRGMETFQVTQYLDYVNIMSYDLHGAWNSHVGPNAALFDSGEDSELAAWDVYSTPEYQGIGYLNTDWAVRYFRGALPAGRINIGIPYYTRGFRNVEGGTNGLWGQAKLPNQSECPKGTGSGDQNFCGNGAVGIDNLWHDIENDREVPAGSNPLWHVKNLADGVLGSYVSDYGLDPENDEADAIVGSYQQHVDQTSVSPWLWNDQKKVFISIENESSMKKKVDYVIDQGLGGVMFWELAGDFDYDAVKKEYFMGSTMTGIAYDSFKQSGQAYDIHLGDENYLVPDKAVEVSFSAHSFPNGDDNYPISPSFSFTNNSEIDLSGAKITFDVPVSTSAIFKSNWNAQKKLKLTVEKDAGNTAGNNIGGFENEFHRFGIELVDEWGSVTQSFKPGETIDVQVMYYLPITGPTNFTISKGEASYAFSFEYPLLPIATPDDGGNGDGDNGNGDSCEGIDIDSLPVYPDFPRTDWQGNPSHALTGDQMVHNNAVWQAKWWTNAEPSEGDWEQICQF